MTPLSRYQAALQTGHFRADPVQAMAIACLEQIYQAFIAHEKKTQIFWRRWFCRPVPARGLYLWGGVGIGKTWLMDLFYDSLPGTKKLRTHFHRFMRQIHTELTARQGHADPLKQVAEHIAQTTHILCFDEFFVSDITDAMLLGHLLKALFAQGVTCVVTSNVPPDQLYRNGLQRELFLPAIALLERYLTVLHMPSEKDYRLRVLSEGGAYFYPLNDHTTACMQRAFDSFSHHTGQTDILLPIAGRFIQTQAVADDVIWFDFKMLCAVPRSQLDYLEIAQKYETVLLSNVTPIAPDDRQTIVYLINLVDIFYDAHVKLIISASVCIDEIYTKGALSFEFTRTRSRLIEMQSPLYLQVNRIPSIKKSE